MERRVWICFRNLFVTLENDIWTLKSPIKIISTHCGTQKEKTRRGDWCGGGDPAIHLSLSGKLKMMMGNEEKMTRFMQIRKIVIGEFLEVKIIDY